MKRVQLLLFPNLLVKQEGLFADRAIVEWITQLSD
jgi:hypothetical protein